jgi:uncharacterized protein with HEPN domain
MDNVKTDKYYLEKIVNDIKFVIENTKEMTLDEFDSDEIINSAVNFKFVQISEYSAKLSLDLINDNRDVPWQKMRGLRNKIVHDYDNVFFDVIYNTIKNDLPTLLLQIEKILDKMIH